MEYSKSFTDLVEKQEDCAVVCAFAQTAEQFRRQLVVFLTNAGQPPKRVCARYVVLETHTAHFHSVHENPAGHCCPVYFMGPTVGDEYWEDREAWNDVAVRHQRMAPQETA